MGFDLAAALKDVSNLDTSGNRDQIEYIDIDLIDQDPNNFYQLSKVDELASNIELLGLQQPIRVRDNPDQPGRVTIVSGHRRRAALQLLVDEGKERFREVPCIREKEAGSAALQELRLIYANADTRHLTSAELSKQVERVEALLYQLKEEGMDFPGRMRDHVAEACKVSKSKLARLKVIREKLAQCWQPDYASGELNESVAYALAQMPDDLQKQLHASAQAAHRTAASIQEYIVRDIHKEYNKLTQCTCEDGSFCTHVQTMAMRMMHRAMAHSLYYTCQSCCATCSSLTTCLHVCPKLAQLAKEKKEQQKQKSDAAAQVKAEEGRKYREQVTRLWQRFREAREAAGKSAGDCMDALDWWGYSWDEEKFSQAEQSGPDDMSNAAYADLPYGFEIDLECIQPLLDAADFLGCSLDYLLCRTDDPHSRLYGQPLTQKQIDEMHFDKVWLSYGDGDPDDGEWAVVIDGWLYDIATLDGADFAGTVMDEFSHIAEKLDRPSGKYTVHYGPPYRQTADQRG